MAVGNTFGATALSSYGGFWLSFAIILTPGGFNIEEGIITAGGDKALYDSLGFYLMVSLSTTIPHHHNTFVPQSNAFKLGLVHIHYSSLVLHIQIDRGILFPVLYARPGVPPIGHRLSSTIWRTPQ